MSDFKEGLLMAVAIVVDRAADWDWLNILLLLGGFYALGLGIYWQLRRGDGFDLRQLVAELGPREKWTVMPGKVYQTGGFLVMTYGFIYQTVHGNMTEWYLLFYGALCSGTRTLNQFMAAKMQAQGLPTTEQPDPPKPLPPDPPPPDVVAEATVTVAAKKGKK